MTQEQANLIVSTSELMRAEVKLTGGFAKLIDGKVYGIDPKSWNGEKWLDCWLVTEHEGYIMHSKQNFIITPQYSDTEDPETESYPIIGYSVELA